MAKHPKCISELASVIWLSLWTSYYHVMCYIWSEGTVCITVHAPYLLLHCLNALALAFCLGLHWMVINCLLDLKNSFYLFCTAVPKHNVCVLNRSAPRITFKTSVQFCWCYSRSLFYSSTVHIKSIFAGWNFCLESFATTWTK